MTSSPFTLFSQFSLDGSTAALITFVVYTIAVFSLAFFSHRLKREKGFLSEYFLGSRGLGMWAFALTFAATSASGGSFMGFPSKIYSHGWILALWIASYMVLPVVSMGLLGKRLNQMGRRAGAITVPDVVRARFPNRLFSILATLLIIFFLSCNLVAQFKAGALMLQTLLDEVPLFQDAVSWTGRSTEGHFWIGNVEPEYFVSLSFFAAAVILYTAYGGFRAVVWSDVLQGFVMVLGVAIMLPLALSQVGGLAQATRDMTEMTPPVSGIVSVQATQKSPHDIIIPFGTWLEQPADGQTEKRLFRTTREIKILAGQQEAFFLDTQGTRKFDIPVLQITTPAEIKRIKIPFQKTPLIARLLQQQSHAYGHDRRGVYVNGPGPSLTDETGFLPISVAISFFFFWTFAAAGQPSNMVRLMAFNNSTTLRRAIVTVSIYYSLIYFPLVIIFCCARVLLPGMEIESDRIMPAMAEHLTRAANSPWLAGLLLAAPFAAVMSTVDSFLLIISSAVVRDVYQREWNPQAEQKTMRRLAYAVTSLIGITAVFGALNPPTYLQDIIVFTGGGLSACFLIPISLGLYWSRFNAPGAIAGMLGGFLCHVALYGGGFLRYGYFRPLRIANFDPFLPEVFVSLVAALLVTFMTRPPSEQLTRKFFYPAVRPPTTEIV